MTAVERPSARFVDRLWRSAATCGVHLPLTIFYFVTVIVLFVLSIALMPLFLLGVPMLAMTLRYVRMLAAAERGRCRGLILVSVDAPTRRSAGLVRGVLNDLRAARTWRQLTYFAVALPIVGLAGYALPFALAGVGVAGMIVPFLPKPAHPVPLPVSVRGLGWWWLPIGVVCVVVACWLVQKCANGWARLVRLLLGRGVEDQLSERIEPEHSPGRQRQWQRDRRASGPTRHRLSDRRQRRWQRPECLRPGRPVLATPHHHAQRLRRRTDFLQLTPSVVFTW